MNKPKVYMHSSESMPEIKTGSAALMIGASVYLGKGVSWFDYEELYTKIYVHEGQRILREDGVLLVVQTNAYEDGKFTCRYAYLVTMMEANGFVLIDERVWQRRAADHYQVPFSHVLVFKPPTGTAKRNKFNKRSNKWFQGIWRYKQTKGGAHNAYPPEFCRMIIEACTEKGDIIVDPLAGTGKLLQVATEMGRQAIGYEIDKGLASTLRANGCLLKKGKPLITKKPRKK